MPVFAVDLDRLDAVIDVLGARGVVIDDQLAELDERIAALQQAWTGGAADAQLEAHRQWLTGAQEMRDGLAAMRLAAAAAHANYCAAVAANVAMWA